MKRRRFWKLECRCELESRHISYSGNLNWGGGFRQIFIDPASGLEISGAISGDVGGYREFLATNDLSFLELLMGHEGIINFVEKNEAKSYPASWPVDIFFP